MFYNCLTIAEKSFDIKDKRVIYIIYY